MTPDEREARASIIQQIIQDSVFQDAVQGVRRNAIEKLVSTDPKDQTAIIEAQCLVKTVDVWDYILTTLRKEHQLMKLQDAMELHYALQCQNGSLERNFAHLRKLEQRLGMSFCPQPRA